jgi:hypothetical protein
MRLVEPNGGPEGAQGRSRGWKEPRLTRMAASALMGEEGYDVQGYANYRGVQVVGAWTWLPEYGMGVATEVAAAEAFRTHYLLRQAFIVLFLLLVLSGLGIFAFTLWVETLQASIRNDTVASRRLGQYVLLQEIGRGANGMVYRARHALLRRPVAIKLLSPDLTNDDTAARFEHEVQMTSQLTHPNTVAIYDYGRTPEGLFYYAMEFLSGIDLDQLARNFGPQPEGRVIHILRQVCGSLAVFITPEMDFKVGQGVTTDVVGYGMREPLAWPDCPYCGSQEPDPFEFDVDSVSPATKDPWGNVRMAASASTVISPKDFGLTWNTALETGGVLVGDDVTIDLVVQFVKAQV